MSNIFIDLTIAHSNNSYITGAGEYALRVFEELNKTGNNIVVGLLSANEYSERVLNLTTNNQILKYKDCSDLTEQIKTHNINTIFFPQIISEYLDFKIPCNTRVIGVWHDLASIIDWQLSQVKLFGRFYNASIKDRIKFQIRKVLFYNKIKNKIINEQLEIYNKLRGIELITVSHFSKSCINYYLGSITQPVKVFYSPLKNGNVYKDSKLSEHIKTKYAITEKKYFLFCNGSRIRKNNTIAILALDNFITKKNLQDFKAVILGSNTAYKNYVMKHLKNKNSFVFDSYIESNDMEALYKFAHLFVFPSVIEGFGYPPVEAMKYGTLTACSTACSIPEIVQDAAFYFNPFDKNSIELAYQMSFDEDYVKLKEEKIKTAYNFVSNKQDNDLKELVNYILKNIHKTSKDNLTTELTGGGTTD